MPELVGVRLPGLGVKVHIGPDGRGDYLVPHIPDAPDGAWDIRLNGINHRYLTAVCPCGCRHAIHIWIWGPQDPPKSPEVTSDIWTWNGNMEQPTISPSIHYRADLGGCGFHGFFLQGLWRW